MDRNALAAPNSSTFLILIRRLISAGLTRQAIRAFDIIEAFVGSKTTSLESGFLIDTLCKYGYVKLAVDVFNRRKREFFVGVKIYTVLIYGWCKIGRRDMPERFLRDLAGICREASLHPEELFGRTIRHVKKVFDEMRHRGIEPDTTRHSIVVHVCIRAHKPELTMEKLGVMKRSGLSPTAAT